MADRRADKIYVRTAENVAHQPDLYDLPDRARGWLGEHIDLWSYESELPQALSQLADRESDLAAGPWIRSLVPFVAGLFARGPEQNQGRNNEGRVQAFQEMLAPIMASTWTVLHYQEDVMTSDRAIAPVDTMIGCGLAIPLDRSSALLLSRCSNREVAFRRGDGWYASVNHYDMQAGEAASLRDALACFALDCIFGATPAAVSVHRSHIGSKNRTWPSLIVNPAECDLICHLYDYFRVASALRVVPSQAQAAADRVDLDDASWCMPIAVECLYPERTRGGVTVVGEASIGLNLEPGLDLWRKRRAVGDFMRGASPVFPIEHLRSRAISLGAQWQQSQDGRRQRTYATNLATGEVRKIDLRRTRD